jgi:hypothetical protein
MDCLAPAAGTQDETDVRTAFAELLAEVLNGALDANDVARRLESLANAGPIAVLTRFAALYVYAKFRKTFMEYELDRKGRLPTNKMLQEIRTYLVLTSERLASSLKSSTIQDWGQVTRSHVSRLFERVFRVYGGERL